MTAEKPDLRDRLDAFVIGLLDEAEGKACGTHPSNDTENATLSEDSPAPAVTHSLTERVAVARICIAWWNARSGKVGADGEPDATGEPEIVRLADELKRREGRRRR